jgi:hypothetical protein
MSEPAEGEDITNEEDRSQSSCSVEISTGTPNESRARHVPKKKQMATDNDAMLSEAFAILKKSSESTPVATITDECQSFANFIADKLQTYSAQKRAKVQQAICNVVFSADLGYSDATYNYTAFPQPATRFSPSSGTYNENYYPNHPAPSVHTPTDSFFTPPPAPTQQQTCTTSSPVPSPAGQSQSTNHSVCSDDSLDFMDSV